MSESFSVSHQSFSTRRNSLFMTCFFHSSYFLQFCSFRHRLTHVQNQPILFACIKELQRKKNNKNNKEVLHI